MALLLIGESLLIALVSGAVGGVFAVWAGGVLRTVLFRQPTWLSGPFDVSVATYAVVTSLVTGGIVAFVVGIQLRESRLGRLAQSSAARHRRAGGRVRTVSVGLQAVLATGLLVVTIVVLRSAREVIRTGTGFDVRRTVFVDASSLPSGESAIAFETVKARLSASPYVEQISTSSTRLGGGGSYEGYFPDANRDRRDKPPGVTANVSPGFVATVGAKVIRGRDFESLRTDGATAEVIVNSAMASRLWPHDGSAASLQSV